MRMSYPQLIHISYTRVTVMVLFFVLPSS
jgi:hypothetical protein